MKLTMLVASVLILTGCSTTYQANSFTGGFSEAQLDTNVWRVKFEGNGYTDEEKSEDLALLRSAELTLMNGFTHFGLANSKSGATTGSYTTPTTYNTVGSAYTSGNTIYGTARTTASGGQKFSFSMPSSTNTVVMFKSKPDAQSMVYDAKFVCDSLGKIYEVICKGKK